VNLCNSIGRDVEPFFAAESAGNSCLQGISITGTWEILRIDSWDRRHIERPAARMLKLLDFAACGFANYGIYGCS
jgi:hypothetical protein